MNGWSFHALGCSPETTERSSRKKAKWPLSPCPAVQLGNTKDQGISVTQYASALPFQVSLFCVIRFTMQQAKVIERHGQTLARSNSVEFHRCKRFEATWIWS
jgi:hypothetical protein